MNLENSLAIPTKKDIGFYVASGAYMFTGLIDGLLTIQGIGSGIATDYNPLLLSLIDFYGVGGGVAITKSNALMALMASEIIERRAESDTQRNFTRSLLYSGTVLSGIGIIGWVVGA
jgi:hypothetical protein